MRFKRSLCVALWSCSLAFAGVAAHAAPSGPPVRIGSTLALTGPLAATAQVHKLVGEIYVEQRATDCSAAR
jgi:hypothetical protein